jgi:hypothetical protein
MVSERREPQTRSNNMSTINLQQEYEIAVEKFGQEAADKAAEIGVAAYNTNAVAGLSQEECEAEQLAAFKAELE